MRVVSWLTYVVRTVHRTAEVIRLTNKEPSNAHLKQVAYRLRRFVMKDGYIRSMSK
jgi:predicted deacetylase